MDKSKTYILQCQKATEIQEAWEPAIGDYVLRRFTVFGEPLDSQIWPGKDAKEEVTILHYHSSVPQYWHGVTTSGESRTVEFPDSGKMVKATSICLFRQDQLQEMVFPPDTRYSIIIQMFVYNWLAASNRGGFKETFYVKSMEQLWLSYVMSTKYGKYWSGSDWTK